MEINVVLEVQHLRISRGRSTIHIDWAILHLSDTYIDEYPNIIGMKELRRDDSIFPTRTIRLRDGGVYRLEQQQMLDESAQHACLRLVLLRIPACIQSMQNTLYSKRKKFHIIVMYVQNMYFLFSW